MSSQVLISRTQEEKNTRYSGSKLGKILTCHTSVWNYPVFTYNLNCSLFHMVSHFFIIYQRNVLPDPFYFTFASMSLCHILGKSLQTIDGRVPRIIVKGSYGSLKYNLIRYYICLGSPVDLSEDHSYGL